MRGGPRWQAGGLGAHHVGLGLEGRVVVDPHARELGRGGNPALHLLHHMPRLMRQVLLLAWRQMDVGALRIRQRVELRRLR